MPNFFFDVILDGLLLADAEGADLPDLDAAHAELIKSTGEYIRDLPASSLENAAECVTSLRDASGQELLRFELKTVKPAAT